MVKVFVFDVETNDKQPVMFGKNWKERKQTEKLLLNPNNFDETWSRVIDKWPHIIQLSYILYDTNNPKDAVIYNKYIDIPDNVIITEETVKIHHITREFIQNMSSKNKVNIEEALNTFLHHCKNADIIVGHSVHFDRKMIIAELLRLSKKEYLPQIVDMMDDSNFECTMEKTMPICNLKLEKYNNKIKKPKLSEAYKYFFGYEPISELLHNALIDVVVCLRVYLKYNNFPDVCGKNDTITKYIVQISPLNYKGKCIKNISYEIKTKRRKKQMKNRSTTNKTKKYNKSKKYNKI